MPLVSDSSNPERESTRQTACRVPCPSYQPLNTKKTYRPGSLRPVTTLSSGPDVSPCQEGADKPGQAPLEVCGSLFCETGMGWGPQHSAMFTRPRHPNGEVSHHNRGLRCCSWVRGWGCVRGVGGKET